MVDLVLTTMKSLTTQVLGDAEDRRTALSSLDLLTGWSSYEVLYSPTYFQPLSRTQLFCIFMNESQSGAAVDIDTRQEFNNVVRARCVTRFCLASILTFKTSRNRHTFQVDAPGAYLNFVRS